MENKNKWQQWQPRDQDLEQFLQSGFSQRLQAHHPLAKLRTNLLRNICWGWLITLAYLLIIVLSGFWQIQLTIGITTLFNLIILFQAHRLYASISTAISPEEPVLATLKRHHRNITAWKNVQMKLAILVYPVAATGGYFYGGVVGSGRTVNELLHQQIFVWALPVTLIFLVPLSLYLARWLFKKSFGVYLDQLQSMIDALEQ